MSKLTIEQVHHYKEEGYVTNLNVFDNSEIPYLVEQYDRLRKLVPEHITPDHMVGWHQFDKPLFDLCCDSRVLDCVEQVIGSNIMIWGSQILAKDPSTEVSIDWHQDNFYWPLDPMNVVTVWIAMIDSTTEVGCMKVVPKSHNGGLLKHNMQDRKKVKQGGGLYLELDESQFDPEEAVPLELKAGQASLHHSDMVHGSEPNISKDKKRIGLIARFSPTNVKCDLSIWQKFHPILVRGTDEYKHNPMSNPPTGKLEHYVEVLPLTSQEARERQLNQNKAFLQ